MYEPADRDGYDHGGENKSEGSFHRMPSFSSGETG
jgi:hypothetical protein